MLLLHILTSGKRTRAVTTRYTRNMSANNTDPKVIGKRVRAAREKFGWNQTELASRMGVRPNYVNRLEAGTMGNPSAERLAAVASALGLSIVDLTSAPPPLPPDVLENLARLTGNDRQLLNEVVATLLAFPPDSREDAIRFTVLSLQTMLKMQARS